MVLRCCANSIYWSACCVDSNYPIGIIMAYPVYLLIKNRTKGRSRENVYKYLLVSDSDVHVFSVFMCPFLGLEISHPDFRQPSP